MIIVFPFHSGDVERVRRLLEWIGQLGGCPNHTALLMADASVSWSDGSDLLDLANSTFRSVSFLVTDEPVKGWPQGPNALFLKAAETCSQLNQPFLFLESDVVPLCHGWLDKLQEAYNASTKRLMGFVYTCEQPGLPRRLISGVSIYPQDTYELTRKTIASKPDIAWDVSTADLLADQFEHTALIHHFNPPKDSPVTFPTTMKVEDIRKDAVLFHSNKDGTLISELRKKLNFSSPRSFVVVLPFFNYDSNLAESLLQWIITLRTPLTHEVLLSYDASTLGMTVKRMEAYAGMCFTKVHKTSYRIPGGIRFPQTAAWQHAARVMHKMDRPWMWMEPDCVPLRQDWLTTLQNTYDKCGKPFAGPIVHERGWCNGTAIYPARTPEFCPRTMSHTENAWDVEMASEMLGQCHDIGRIWHCAWGTVGGRLSPIEGDSPSFNESLLRQIPTSAVIFHRCKDSSLISLLRPRIAR